MSKNFKIFRREYDGKPEGFSNDKLKNEFLGEFTIEDLSDGEPGSGYEGQWIGTKDGKKFLITQTEVSGMYWAENGGSRFEIKEIDIEVCKHCEEKDARIAELEDIVHSTRISLNEGLEEEIKQLKAQLKQFEWQPIEKYESDDIGEKCVFVEKGSLGPYKVTNYFLGASMGAEDFEGTNPYAFFVLPTPPKEEV